MGKIIDITDMNFDGIVINNKNVLVDYWAPWCHACINVIEPILKEIAMENDIIICKYNVEDNTAYAKHIKSLPTLILYRYGVPIDQIIGGVGKQKILDMMKEAL